MTLSVYLTNKSLTIFMVTPILDQNMHTAPLPELHILPQLRCCHNDLISYLCDHFMCGLLEVLIHSLVDFINALEINRVEAARQAEGRDRVLSPRQAHLFRGLAFGEGRRKREARLRFVENVHELLKRCRI